MSKTIKSKNEEKQEKPCPWIWKTVFQIIYRQVTGRFSYFWEMPYC